MTIAFWGSSLVSAYWNGAATYYRGILRALAERGHRIVFYEPDAYDRQTHRDIPDPEWAQVVVYQHEDLSAVAGLLRESALSDVVVKASGVGVLDELLESEIAHLSTVALRVFWDVDAPATLERMAANPADHFRKVLPFYNLVLTYGGGQRVVWEYRERGAGRCEPVYNAFDPDVHHPAERDPRFAGDLSFLANRLPDREARVEEYFLKAATTTPGKRFVLGGNGWGGKPMPENVRYVGHVYTRDHNAFNCSAQVVLNVSRDSMARYGFSPATRVFEAAGAAACLITDAWEGLDAFLKPGEEVLVADSGEQVAHLVNTITPERAKTIGEAARRRVLNDHTYSQRGTLVESVLIQALLESRDQRSMSPEVTV